LNTNLLFLLLILIIAGCQSSSTKVSETQNVNNSLYLQLGGQETVNIAIISMVKRLHNDERLSELFNDVNDIELIQNFNDFICQLTGGGCEYQGATMEDIHTGLSISKAEFDRFVSMFIFSMQDANIAFPAQNKLLDKLAGLRDEVIEL